MHVYLSIMRALVDKLALQLPAPSMRSLGKGGEVGTQTQATTEGRAAGVARLRPVQIMRPPLPGLMCAAAAAASC